MKITLLTFICFTLLSCGPAPSKSKAKKEQSWTLKTGDKLTGKIVRHKEGEITIGTPAGKKTIALSKLNKTSYLKAETQILFELIEDDNAIGLQYAIERQAPLDIKDKYGDSLLHKASQHKSAKVAALLVKNNPESLKLLNDDGFNAYDLFSLDYSDWKSSLTAIQRKKYKTQPDYGVYRKMGKLFSRAKAKHGKEFVKAMKERKKAFYAEKKKRAEDAKPKLDHLKDYISEELNYADGDRFDTNKLDGKIIAFYFSASWCPPCRAFTPKLIDFRNKFSNDFEVIFVSADRSSSGQTDYMNKYAMPWPATKWRGRNADTINSKFAVRGIPALVVINSKGEVVSRRGTGDLQQVKFSSIPSSWK